MRLSREKIVRISHQLVDLLVQSNDVEFVEDRDSIRQHIVQTMTNILREEEKIEANEKKEAGEKEHADLQISSVKMVSESCKK